MARTSFRLRRVTGGGDATGVGSYVRGTDAFQTLAGASLLDQDSAIRSDGIVTVTETTDASEFYAAAVQYNAVYLRWTLTDEIVDVNTINSGESGIVGVAIVYSKTGDPQTVIDGSMIVSGNVNEYLHQNLVPYNDNGVTKFFEEPEPGKWAYYTLFAYINTDGPNGSFYYQRLASLEVIVPFNYGSSEELWKRIPLYYREQDLKNNNQLKRFLEIFGFEIDRTRTLIDNVMVQYDPLTSEGQSIEQLASMFGLELRPSDIGTSRIRSLLYDVGYLRKNKGTLSGTRDYLTAVSGGQVDIVYNGASAAPYYSIRVHSERANLVADPRFVVTDDTTWRVFSQNGASVSTLPSEGITITAGSSGDKVALVGQVAVPVSADNNYYMSAEFSTYPASVVSASWTGGTTWSNWSPSTTAASISVGVANRYAYEMYKPTASGNYRPVLLLQLSANQSVTLYRWMVEPNRTGSFFDGSSVLGGFLYQNYVSDYTWSGTAYASYSQYTMNRKKTQDALLRLIPDILPVTLLGTSGGQPKYTVSFDWIPGRTS